MKKIVFFIMLTCTGMSLNVHAQHIDDGTTGNLTWSLDIQGGDTLFTINGSDTMPDYYDWSGGAPWDAYKGNITTAIIGDGITTIGRNAFKECRNLTTVTIPNSVTIIGSSAFSQCLKLASVTIPNNVRVIGIRAFASCVNLTAITIPDSVTSIEMETFLNCRNLTSVTIPNSVTSIKDHAFTYCYSLTSITLPDSLITLEGAFSCCISLTSIVIPNSVIIINDHAFSLCYSLASVTISNSATSIGISAFRDCSSLTSITIPNSVDTIWTYAFKNCNSLTSITSYAIIPPDIIYRADIPGSFTFENVPDTIPVYIPCGTYTDYSTASGWDYFSNFIEMPTKKIDTGFYAASFKQGGVYNDDNFTGLTEGGLYYKSIRCDSVVCLNLTSYTSISEWTVDNGKWKIYPNPTTGQLIIDNGRLTMENMELYDVYGKSVLRHCELRGTKQEAIQIINISHLSTGIYFLRIETENGIIIKKVIKE